MNTTARGLRVLVTAGAAGIGKAFAEVFADAGAKVFICDVDRAALDAFRGARPEIGAGLADVADPRQVDGLFHEASVFLGGLDVLINNAGIAIYDDLSKLEVIEQHLAVNLFGPLNVTHAFLPLLKRSKGTIVNNLSLAGLAPLPVIPAYSISKAAAFNMTQSLRALLAGQGVTVHAVVLGPIDTDMNRGFEIPKASPESAAVGIFDGLEKGEEDIFPDPASQSIAEGWRTGAPKALERQFAPFVQESAA